MRLRRWLITGVSTGLGRALAEAAIARGEKVAGTARKMGDLAAFEAIAPGRSFGIRLDLREEAAIAPAVAAAEAALGAIDVLVNNAGFGLVGAVEEASSAEVRDQFEVNLFAPLALIRAALPAMRARRSGFIVNVTSVSGLATWAGTGIYCASKFALEAIGETLAAEVAELGIRVMNIAPGGMRTDYASRSLVSAEARLADYDGTARQAKILLSEHAGHEAGDPARVASAILDALGSPNPPVHLVLGEDALHYAEARIATLHSEIASWRELALSTRSEKGP
ncbi:MAG: oxidoreductase [Caulobacteraceae bacterium]